MNLFILDLDPIKAAKQNCDKHVCKIILEAADCLVTAHWETGGLPKNAPSILTTQRVRQDKRGNLRRTYPYYPQSHINNHVTKWVRESKENYDWTVSHGLALSREYTRRYDKIHSTHEILAWLDQNRPSLPSGVTPFRQAVANEPVECVRPNDVVLAYKLYYAYYKCGFAKWKAGNTPQWYLDMRELITLGCSIDQVEMAA